MVLLDSFVCAEKLPLLILSITTGSVDIGVKQYKQRKKVRYTTIHEVCLKKMNLVVRRCTTNCTQLPQKTQTIFYRTKSTQVFHTRKESISLDPSLSHSKSRSVPFQPFLPLPTCNYCGYAQLGIRCFLAVSFSKLSINPLRLFTAFV